MKKIILIKQQRDSELTGHAEFNLTSSILTVLFVILDRPWEYSSPKMMEDASLQSVWLFHANYTYFKTKLFPTSCSQSHSVPFIISFPPLSPTEGSYI